MCSFVSIHQTALPRIDVDCDKSPHIDVFLQIFILAVQKTNKLATNEAFRVVNKLNGREFMAEIYSETKMLYASLGTGEGLSCASPSLR